MEKKNIIKEIKKAAENDKKKRKDIRYLRAMAWFVKKGFLKTNQDFTKWNLGKLCVQDAIWAGKHLEPRILEVLPAAMVRLPKEFVRNQKEPKALNEAIQALATNQKEGPLFMGIDYDKYKVWVDLKLNDGRTKPMFEQKQMRSFRLSPTAIRKLNQLRKESGLSGSEIIELLL